MVWWPLSYSFCYGLKHPVSYLSCWLLSQQRSNTKWKIELYTSHTKVIMLLIDHSLSFPEKQNKIYRLGGQWYFKTILFADLLRVIVGWIVKYLFHLWSQRVFTSTLGMYLTCCKTSTLKLDINMDFFMNVLYCSTHEQRRVKNKTFKQNHSDLFHLGYGLYWWC